MGTICAQLWKASGEQSKSLKSPVVLLAETVKGKGVSFMEDIAGWHGKVPNKEEMERGLGELGLTGKIPIDELFEHAKAYQAGVEKKLDAKMPKFSRDYWWNKSDTMKV